MNATGTPRPLRALVYLGICSALAATGAATLPRAAAKDLEVPETGTAVQRTRALWEDSRSRILADAKAALSDAEYQKRRAPIWNAWSRLQMYVAGEDDAVSEIIPDILGVLNNTYGWVAEPPEKRQEARDQRRKYIPEDVAKLDKRIAALKP